MLGIFDSGSGGLTVLKEIRAKMPEVDVVYFGDIKNAPYGNRSLEELGNLTINGFEILLKNGATNFVSACNSVSAYIALPIFSHSDISKNNIIEMVGPTVGAFRQRRNARPLLVGTNATVNSKIYQDGFKELGMEITAIPIPTLAGAIESGENEEVLKNIIQQSFENIDTNLYTDIILACTHFPLVRHIFVRVLASRDGTPEPVDPASFVAEEVSLRFDERGSGKMKFLISNDSNIFRERVYKMFGDSDVEIVVLE